MIRTIGNFLEDLSLWIKNRITSSKYVIKGKCKQCGNCCRNILFSDENGYIKNEQDFYNLQKNNRRYRHFDINGKVEDEHNSLLNGALLFKCKSLGKDGKCQKYIFRSLCCRDYPSINPYFISTGGQTLDGCGFYFDVDKKFEEYLN